ncbi:Molybdenum cofactor guanylyltransferase (EC [Olavius algarvensis associated proteobacterium Delta 3]|nr:Molybdenum cofactor guanylyltransferase (EC [Olavius algarvensis associated proteobacterium Delta 3]CAB5145431.1 Molybdenum cofactor guanylyltransferase (EC [Olavius algarvensis associated proteobacterium Delta 3]
MEPCTGVLLAGGRNTRFSGENKAFVSVGGKRMVDRIYGVFSKIFDEILIVTNDPLDYIDLDASIVGDIYPVRSSLTGLHAGLFYASRPYAFFSACDTPFISRDLLVGIMTEVDPSHDIVLPETEAGLEPLCAVYSKRCLHIIETLIQQNTFKIQALFRRVRLKKLPPDRIARLDPHGFSFFNVNSHEDRSRADRVAAGLQRETQ